MNKYEPSCGALGSILNPAGSMISGVHGGRTIGRKRLLTHTIAWTAGVGLILQGCMSGQVRDAQNGTAMANVDVDAHGTCAGAGCVSGTQGHVVTDNIGEYVFDAYGDLQGVANAQHISLGAGQHAVEVVFTAPGSQYISRTVYHRPKYSPYTPANVGGRTYDNTTLPIQYLCKVGQVDSDSDGVCDFAEAQYGTDPNSNDTDGDGFSDWTELFGLASAGVDLRFYGASALHKDVFVYVDYYEEPDAAALAQSVATFANASVSNPDGVSGINLHIIKGQEIDAADQVLNFSWNMWPQFDVIKAKYFPAHFAEVAHYGLIAHQIGGTTVSGYSRGIPAHDFLVTLGMWNNGAGGTTLQHAGTFLHELGHNLGLRHGGNENRNYKPNYLSVMSYRYQVFGMTVDRVPERLDYSRLQIASVDETNLAELAGFAPVAPTTEFELARFSVVLGSRLWGKDPVDGAASGWLDFDEDGMIDFGTLANARNLDGNRSSTDVFAASQNDWENIIYVGATAGGGVIGGGIGAGTSTSSSTSGSAGGGSGSGYGGNASLIQVAPIAAIPQLVAPEDMPMELTEFNAEE